MQTNNEEVLGQFHGDENFAVDWDKGEKDLFWILDDLHCPKPDLTHVLRYRWVVAYLRPYVSAGSVRRSLPIGSPRT